MGAVVRAIREEQGLTQEQVAERYGVTDGAIAAYEQGRSRFTIQDLPSLADALGVPVPFLSRRLGLCGENDDLTAILTEYAGPEIASLVASAVQRYPDLDPERRHAFAFTLRNL